MWQDATSYSKNEPLDSRVPRAWDWDSGLVRLTVHRWHGIPDTWFASAKGLFDKCELEASDVEEAKKEAAGLLLARIDALTEACKPLAAWRDDPC